MTAARCPQCHGPKHPNAVFQASHPAPEPVRQTAALIAASILWAGAVYAFAALLGVLS